MILTDFRYKNKKIPKLTLQQSFTYWRVTLLEKMLNIFRWENLPESIPQKEIEMALILTGFSGIVENKNKLYATMGAMSGVTAYPDVFTLYTFATPVFSGMRNIGKECAIIDNNYSRFGTIHLIDRYATLLAHSDMSYQTILINSRATGILAAKDDEQAVSINEWYKKLEIGETMAVVDENQLSSLINAQGLRNVDTSYPDSSKILDYYESTENILRSFYEDIGLSKSKNKKERMVVDEVKQDNNRILYDVSHMLQRRKEGCEIVNNIFNENWNVELNEQYSDYSEDDENDNNKTD